jgi:hypothetical protein
MKSNYRSRIAALAAEVVHSPRFAPPRPPFFVWSDEGTTPDAIRAARQQQSAIVYVQRASSDNVEIVIDNVPEYVTWATPQDCPMSVERFHANLTSGELVGPQYAGWMRPEEERQEERQNENRRHQPDRF